MKKCTRCSAEKDEQLFPITGKGYLSNKCKCCTEDYKKEWKLKNLVRVKEVNDKWKSENREHYLKSLKKIHAKNSENQDYITKRKTYNSNFHKLNPQISRNAASKRRARTKEATLFGFDKEILDIYKSCPKGFHVDHIVPLNGETVSGLHVPWNLRSIPAEENLKKSNKLLDLSVEIQ